jgi:peptidoglycan/xylan/chitin deacetylase (PgdA/CDA1 family)
LLALTFDDGPDPRGTPSVLEALERAEVFATFFVLAERVEQHPELLERVLLAGHDVQIHGYEHLRHPYTPRADVENDIDRALSVVPATKWRIPWGHLAEYTREVAAERSLTIVGWDADTHDWRGDSAEAMLAQLRLEPGGIVLAHDGVGAGARRETAVETARLVGPLVKRARERGLEPGPLRTPWPTPLPLGNPNFATP